MRYWPLGLMVLVACHRSLMCDAPEGQSPLPAKLSETGIEQGVPYEPLFALWSDGAAKRRFIFLPPGSAIDKSDPNDWSFPVGTKLWKEFSVNGVRVETRLLQRTETRWEAMAYVWNGDDAIATPAGATNAVGTTHDVPAAGDCEACHGGRKSHVLGYSAVQLGEVTFGGTAEEHAAFGYLHANCSHCHNQARPPHDGARCYDPENELEFRVLANGDTPAARTKDKKEILERFSEKKMPPLATEQVDPDGLATLRAWIK
jgi:hypothetical protein